MLSLCGPHKCADYQRWQVNSISADLSNRCWNNCYRVSTIYDEMKIYFFIFLASYVDYNQSYVILKSSIMFNKFILAVKNSSCHWHNFLFFFLFFFLKKVAIEFQRRCTHFYFGFYVCIYNTSIKINCKKRISPRRRCFFYFEIPIEEVVLGLFWLDRLEEVFSVPVNQRLCAWRCGIVTLCGCVQLFRLGKYILMFKVWLKYGVLSYVWKKMLSSLLTLVLPLRFDTHSKIRDIILRHLLQLATPRA